MSLEHSPCRAALAQKMTAADYGLDKPAYPLFPDFGNLINRGRTTCHTMKNNGLPTIEINGRHYVTTPTIVALLNGDLVIGNEINARAA